MGLQLGGGTLLLLNPHKVVLFVGLEMGEGVSPRWKSCPPPPPRKQSVHHAGVLLATGLLPTARVATTALRAF